MSKLFKLRFVKAEQPLNILFIFVTLLVSNSDKSIDFNAEQLSNISPICTTFSVLKFVIFKVVKSEHFLNIQDILYTFEVLKFDTSIDTNFVQPSNIWFITSTFSVLNFVTSKFVIILHSWNI